MPAIYKKGQGYWTRLMSAIGFGTLALIGAIWFSDQLGGVKIGGFEATYVQAAGAVIFLAVCGWFGYDFIGRRRKIVDFMIATEGEMKKVNWSTRREILGSTWVVIGLTIFIALFCFGVDRVFQLFFQAIDVLKKI